MTQSANPTTTNQLPAVNYKHEVRFAVVMYGGVSLAIYINGIAQEMLRWVRSTAKSANKNVALLPNNPSGECELSLSGTERVYRKLSYILAADGAGKTAAERLAEAEQNLAENKTIRTRFVVDILSGTSAGGINGIFLGKALANSQDMSGLENLWVKEGDVRTLINDKKSIEGPLLLQDPPASGGGAPHGDVGLAVAVVIGRHGDVGGEAPGVGGECIGTRLHVVPNTGCGAEHRHVGFQVAVEISRTGNIARSTERKREK